LRAAQGKRKVHYLSPTIRKKRGRTAEKESCEEGTRGEPRKDLGVSEEKKSRLRGSRGRGGRWRSAQ